MSAKFVIFNIFSPFGSFWVCAASFRVDQVIGRPLLLRRGTKHGEYREADGLNGQSRCPVVGQYRQTNVPVGINVGVLGNVGADKGDGGGVEGVAFVELKLKLECLALVEASFGSVNLHNPPEKVS